ncbi:MAG TPA: cobalamin-dependent protein, partial [Gemmatimonadales bacterium]|nr:cobalamin-dependent protein [Gemmatimonadales bacterium]
MTTTLSLATTPTPRTRRPLRIVTAASLFDGHDAAINVMRRIIQASGAEVIHLGHNRSAAEIVECAIEEDAHAIAVTSYQGGHIEFFTYMHDLLRERGADVLIFGGGGGTILPHEVETLHAYGIARIYTPDDGRAMGLQGMIDDLLARATRERPPVDLEIAVGQLPTRNPQVIARLISMAENEPERVADLHEALAPLLGRKTVPVLGVTGTGGAGKSSLVDEFVRRYLTALPDRTVAIVSVDPSRRRTGGALLGDRIRMNAVPHPRAYMRSLATRQSNLALSKHVRESIDICRAAGFDLVIVETSGIGQSDTEIIEHSDVSLYVMTAEYGAATQLEKIDMLDFADLVAINKFDKPGSLDALRDVRKQVRRNRTLWDAADEALPVYGTIASQFNDAGMNRLAAAVLGAISAKTGVAFPTGGTAVEREGRQALIPPDRNRYLAEIVEASEAYDRFVGEQVGIARRLYQLDGTLRQ